MARTLGDLLIEFQARVSDYAEGVAQLWELRRFANEGAREIARKTECLRATANVTVAAGTQTYTGGDGSGVPTDVVRLLRCEFTPTGQTQKYPIEHRDFNAMDELWGAQQAVWQGYPSYYTTWGYAPTLALTLWPVPSTAGTLKVFYAKYPADLSVTGSADSSNVDVPNGWEDAVMDFMEYRYWLKDRNPEAAQMARARFDEQMAAVAQATTRYVDGPGVVTFRREWGWD